MIYIYLQNYLYICRPLKRENYVRKRIQILFE